ncbi:hypothetical protein D3C86_1925810 [compost metagenome]
MNLNMAFNAGDLADPGGATTARYKIAFTLYPSLAVRVTELPIAVENAPKAKPARYSCWKLCDAMYA